MNTFLLKITLMPTLIGVVTWASRRWGVKVGGWLAGMPVVAGPISLFLAIEQGADFAAHAIVGTTLALVGLVGYIRAYIFLAVRYPWWFCTGVGYAFYMLVAWIFLEVQMHIFKAFLLLVIVILLAIKTIPNLRQGRKPIILPKFDLPIRMGVATLFVVGITQAADYLGSAWSGVLTPFPIITSILAIFTHQQQGARGCIRIMRGLLIGMFGFAMAALMIGLLLPHFSVAVTYFCAFASSIIVNGFTYRFIK